MEIEAVHPKWIAFFDGEQYQQYQNFVKTRDFNKILISNRDSQTEKVLVSELKSLPSEEMTSNPVGGSFIYPEAEYSEIPGEKPLPPPVIYPNQDDRKARKRRTRTYVLLGILMLSLIAMLVALLMHFHLQKSLFGSTEEGGSVTESPPPSYGSFTPRESKTTSLSSLRSSANINNQIISQNAGLVNLKSLTQASHAMNGDLPSLLLDPSKSAIEVTQSVHENDGKEGIMESVTAANVLASLEEKSVSMECILEGITVWQNISIVKLSHVNPKKELEVATMTSLPYRPITAADPRMKPQFVRRGSDLKFIVNIEPPECSDNGFYKCRAVIRPDLTISSRFKVALTNSIQVPVLHVPDELIENKTTRMKTTWYAGHPEMNGNVDWEILNKTTGSFNKLGFSDYKETLETKNCNTIIQYSFLITPQLGWNGTKIKTRIIPGPFSKDLPADLNLVSEPHDVLVVPASVCKGVQNGTFVDHPYTCHKFIRCTDSDIREFVCPNDLCFDLDPDTCVRAST